MTTIVAKTIGTGGDYTTLQSWEDACPASLVAVDQIWQGRCKKQTFSSSSALLTISGTTVDATRYVELTTDTGCSFLDDANARTNPLRYNESVGAAIKLTGSWAAGVTNDQSYTRVSKLQFRATASNGAAFRSGEKGGTVGAILDSSICEASGALPLESEALLVRNSLIVYRGGARSEICSLGRGSVVNCTIVSTTAACTNGIRAAYGTGIVKNCYVGGFSGALQIGSTSFTFTTSAASIASPPAGWTGGVPLSTTNFENVTDGTHDFRLKAGSALIGVGTDDATNSPNDITGTTRTTPWDIGAWEVVAAGGNDALTATGITTATPTLSTPALAQNHVITGSAITASSTVSSPALAQNHSITATGIATAAATLSTPAIAQNHAITASAIVTSPATLSSPAISGDTYNLVATAISTTPTLSTPALTQNHALSGGAIAAGNPTFGTPTLAQQHAMMAVGITAGAAVLSSPVLTEGGAVIFARSPSGSGYFRESTNTRRPTQTSTTRTAQENTIRH